MISKLGIGKTNECSINQNSTRNYVVLTHKLFKILQNIRGRFGYATRSNHHPSPFLLLYKCILCLRVWLTSSCISLATLSANPIAATLLGSDTMTAALIPQSRKIIAGTRVDLPHPAAPTITATLVFSSADVIWFLLTNEIRLRINIISL